MRMHQFGDGFRRFAGASAGLGGACQLAVQFLVLGL
jgi:hypothetical protein